MDFEYKNGDAVALKHRKNTDGSAVVGKVVGRRDQPGDDELAYLVEYNHPTQGAIVQHWLYGSILTKPVK